jgi:copper transport protein
MRALLRLPVLLMVAALLTIITPASAHGYIVRSIPQDRSVLQRPPTRVQYWFSEDLEPDFSSLILRDQTGAVLATGGVDENNQSLMSLRVPTGLPDGAYIVELRPAFASDGHVNAESRVFFVGSEVGGMVGSSQYEVMPLEIVWRVLLMGSIMLLFGAFVVYSFVLVPTWGSVEHQSGFLPPRVMNRLNWIVIVALVVAVAANILALIQQSMVFFNTGAVEVLSQNLWSVVRIGSRFGDVWNVRIALLAIMAALFGFSIHPRNLPPESVRAFWVANVWLMPLVIGTFSVSSHTAGSLMLPWVGIFVDWIHALAVGAWVGGLAALVLVIPTALRPYNGEKRRLALLAVLRRFSRLAVSAVVIVIATGIYSSLNWLSTAAELTGTAWGGALVVKLVLVVGLLLLGLAHQIAANPERYVRWSTNLSRTMSLALTLRLEIIVAIITLVAVANLSATPIPQPPQLDELRPPVSANQTVDGLNISVTLSPGGPGVNTYDTLVTRDGQTLDGVNVRLQMVNPALDWRSMWHEAEAVDSGLYVAAGADINREGRWLTLVDVSTSDGNTSRAAFDWAITDDASVIESRSPGFLNIAALIGVFLALIWAALPLLRRFYHWLHLTPASIAVGVSATVATAFFLVAGYLMIQQNQANYEAMLNPPPQIINPILPDEESLQEGHALFDFSCAVWQLESPDINILKERLPNIRDEQLFAMIRDGWRALSPCSETLADEQRWHIVNYIRIWEQQA